VSRLNQDQREGPNSGPLYPTSNTSLLLPAPQGCDNAIRAESVEALLGGHCILQHVQTDGAHEL
jgi:hypothetical protein